MNLSWDNIDNTLSTLKNYIEKNQLWYGIGNEFQHSKEIIDQLKDTLNFIYKILFECFGPII